MKQKIKLNFGSGCKLLEGYVNIDATKKYGAQKICNMNVFPYPFPNNYADYIFCEMTLEHLKYPTKAIEEFHRIIKPTGEIYIIVPHFSSLNALMADQHLQVFSCWYFELFDIKTKSAEGFEYWWVTKKKFKNVDTTIVFPKGYLTILSFPFQILFGKNKSLQKFYTGRRA